MLTRLGIRGFRSIESIELELGSLTVLIGPNGSGKSNILDAIDLLSDAAGGSLADGIISRGGIGVLAFSGSTNLEVEFRLRFDRVGAFGTKKSPFVYDIELLGGNSVAVVFAESIALGDSEESDTLLLYGPDTPGGYQLRDMTSQKETHSRQVKSPSEFAISQIRDELRFPYVAQLADNVSSWRSYPPLSTPKSSPLRRSQVVRAGMRLDSDAENLASVLFDIQNRDPDAWESILDVLRTAYPGFKSLSFPSEGGDGTIVLRWREEPFTKKSGFSANVLSDGTLRLLMLLAILMTPDPPPLICIDEPELGLHPDWIKIIGDLIQSAATRTQLIVSTHSPELVSKMQPSQVVVVEKEDGRTTAKRLSDDEVSHWLDKFRLGELWRAGHFGGRP